MHISALAEIMLRRMARMCSNTQYRRTKFLEEQMPRRYSGDDKLMKDTLPDTYIFIDITASCVCRAPLITLFITSAAGGISQEEITTRAITNKVRKMAISILHTTAIVLAGNRHRCLASISAGSSQFESFLPDEYTEYKHHMIKLVRMAALSAARLLYCPASPPG